MFAFPVTIPVRTSESVIPVIVTIRVDDVLIVKPLLDMEPPFGVQSVHPDMIPLTELVFTDGRRLPVLEAAHTIHHYLDAYLSIEEFYSEDRSLAANHRVEEVVEERGNVVPLFGSTKPCDSSEGSTPA